MSSLRPRSRVTLNEPNFTFLNILGAALFMIVDMEHYLDVGEASCGQSPSVTGTFKFVRWDPGERVVLEHNDDYWGEVGAGVDRVVFRSTPDESARVLALLTGEIDMAFSVPADQIGLVERAQTHAGVPNTHLPHPVPREQHQATCAA